METIQNRPSETEKSNPKKRKVRTDETAPYGLPNHAAAAAHCTNKGVEKNSQDDDMMRATTREESKLLDTPIPGHVFAELVKIGFQYTSRNVYTHPDIADRTFENPEAVAQYLVSYGIPNVGRLDELEVAEKDNFLWWVRIINVDRKDLRSATYGLNGLNPVKKMPTDDYLIQLLTELGFRREGNRFYVPGASKVPQYEHEHGVHYFDGLPEVRQYIRGAETLGVKGRNVRCGSRSVVDKASLLLVRVWAATSPAPLPGETESCELRDQVESHVDMQAEPTATVNKHFDFQDESDTEVELADVENHYDFQKESRAPAAATGYPSPLAHCTNKGVEKSSLQDYAMMRAMPRDESKLNDTPIPGRVFGELAKLCAIANASTKSLDLENTETAQTSPSETENRNPKKCKARADETAPYELLNRAAAAAHCTNKGVEKNSLQDDDMMRAMSREESKLLDTPIPGHISVELAKLCAIANASTKSLDLENTETTQTSPSETENRSPKKCKARTDETAPYELLNRAAAAAHCKNEGVEKNSLQDDDMMRAMTREESKLLDTPIPGQVHVELLKLGFQYTSRNVYTHPDIADRTFENPEAVAQYLVAQGIPNVGRLDDLEVDETDNFLWWVRIINVDRKDLRSATYGLNGLNPVKKMPTDDYLIQLLTELGFRREGNRFYVPGASKVPQYEHEHGVHYFDGLPEVRQYIRGAETLGVKGRNVRCGSRSVVDKASLLLVRVWAATSPAPLPAFLPLEEAAGIVVKLSTVHHRLEVLVCSESLDLEETENEPILASERVTKSSKKGNTRAGETEPCELREQVEPIMVESHVDMLQEKSTATVSFAAGSPLHSVRTNQNELPVRKLLYDIFWV